MTTTLARTITRISDHVQVLPSPCGHRGLLLEFPNGVPGGDWQVRQLRHQRVYVLPPDDVDARFPRVGTPEQVAACIVSWALTNHRDENTMSDAREFAANLATYVNEHTDLTANLTTGDTVTVWTGPAGVLGQVRVTPNNYPDSGETVYAHWRGRSNERIPALTPERVIEFLRDELR
jgi:hypothetical protein